MCGTVREFVNSVETETHRSTIRGVPTHSRSVHLFRNQTTRRWRGRSGDRRDGAYIAGIFLDSQSIPTTPVIRTEWPVCRERRGRKEFSRRSYQQYLFSRRPSQTKPTTLCVRRVNSERRAVLATIVRGARSAVVAEVIRGPIRVTDAVVCALPHRAAQLKEEQHTLTLTHAASSPPRRPTTTGSRATRTTRRRAGARDGVVA